MKVNNKAPTEIYIYGEIVDDAEAAAGYEYPSKLKAQLDAIGSDAAVDIHINSEGGSVFAGVAMANMLARHKGKTTCIVDGLAASIATQIFFSADVCKMPSNCYLMLHCPFTATTGNAAELRKRAEVLDTLQAGLETTYRRKARAGVTAEEIHEMVKAETWLTGAEAASKFDIRLLESGAVVNMASALRNLKARGVRVPASVEERSQSRMLRSDELKQKIDLKQGEIAHYRMALDYKNVSKATAELQLMQEALETAERKEREDLMSFAAAMKGVQGAPSMMQATAPLGQPIMINSGGYSEAEQAKLRNRAFNKLVLSGARGVPAQLTEDEKYAYYNVSGSPGSPGQIEAVPSRGGYLVSQDQLKTLYEYRAAFVALKDYTTVVTANSSYGRWPALPDQAIEFQPLVELTDIAEGDVTFSELEYKIEDYAFIIPASNQLLEDADVSLIDVIGRTLAKGAVRTENKKILEPLNTLIASAPTVSDYKALNTALYKTLDGIFEPSAKIFVNQDSFVWLSNLEDGTGRPLLIPDVTAPSTYLYRGKEIVVLPNSVTPNSENGSLTLAPILIGSMSDYATFFERKGLELSTSTETYWRKNAIGVRAILRFDVVVTDARAMVALNVAV